MTEPALDCTAAMRQLWDYLDSELDPAAWLQVSAHLAVCGGCSAHVSFARAFLTHVATAPVRGAEVAALKDRVALALQAEG